jgi:hypothetical protein
MVILEMILMNRPVACAQQDEALVAGILFLEPGEFLVLCTVCAGYGLPGEVLPACKNLDYLTTEIFQPPGCMGHKRSKLF